VIGVIQNYDPETETGAISNGKELFQFDISDWIAGAAPERGDNVTFDLRGVKPCNINLYVANLNKSEAVKYKWVAIPLALFLGFVGAHRIYLGYYRLAITQIIVNAVLFVAGLQVYAFLWGFVETILILGGHIDKDAKNRPLK
jgi:hypothetical protein